MPPLRLGLVTVRAHLASPTPPHPPAWCKAFDRSRRSGSAAGLFCGPGGASARGEGAVHAAPFSHPTYVGGALKGLKRRSAAGAQLAGLLLDRKRLVLRLSVVEHLSKIARVERLAADWAVDQVLRLVLYRPVMRPALIACRDVVGSNPGQRQVPSVVLAADISPLAGPCHGRP